MHGLSLFCFVLSKRRGSGRGDMEIKSIMIVTTQRRMEGGTREKVRFQGAVCKSMRKTGPS